MGTARQDGITTLYHYQGGNLDHLKDTLVNNRVRCAHPEHLNDPWDCQPYFDDRDLADSSRREPWQGLYESYIEQHVPPEEQAEAKASIARWCANDKAVELGIKQLTLSVWTWIVKSYRIYCLTPHPDSLLMWAHYGDKHKGLCLEFDATLPFGRAYRVRYEDKLPVIGPDIVPNGQLLISPIFCTKSSEWSYEDEYRLVLNIGAASPPALEVDGDYLLLPSGTLRAIVAGYEADVGTIRALVQEHAPGVLVRRAIRKFHEYHLDIVDDHP